MIDNDRLDYTVKDRISKYQYPVDDVHHLETWRYLNNDDHSRYFVSDYGRVYDYLNYHMMTPLHELDGRPTKRGFVKLEIDGYKLTAQVDYLIACTFLGKPSEDYPDMSIVDGYMYAMISDKPRMTITHLDGDLDNCKATNLEWDWID